MGLEQGRLYWTRCHHHQPSAAPPNFNPKLGKRSPPLTGLRSISHPSPEGHKSEAYLHLHVCTDRRRGNPNQMCVFLLGRRGYVFISLWNIYLYLYLLIIKVRLLVSSPLNNKFSLACTRIGLLGSPL
jgi:hypothetical protein